MYLKGHCFFNMHHYIQFLRIILGEITRVLHVLVYYRVTVHFAMKSIVPAPLSFPFLPSLSFLSQPSFHLVVFFFLLPPFYSTP